MCVKGVLRVSRCALVEDVLPVLKGTFSPLPVHLGLSGCLSIGGFELMFRTDWVRRTKRLQQSTIKYFE